MTSKLVNHLSNNHRAIRVATDIFKLKKTETPALDSPSDSSIVLRAHGTDCYRFHCECNRFLRLHLVYTRIKAASSYLAGTIRSLEVQVEGGLLR